MAFPFGINSRDVIHEGAGIYGDAVNAVARFKSLADFFGISVFKTLWNHVKNRLHLK